MFFHSQKPSESFRKCLKAPQGWQEAPKGTKFHLLVLEKPWDEMFALKEDAEVTKSWALAKGKKKIKNLQLCQGLDFQQGKWQEGESVKGNDLTLK